MQPVRPRPSRRRPASRASQRRRRWLGLLALPLAALVLASAPRHPNSLSSSRLEIDGQAATLRLRCQALSLLEVVDVDADDDGLIDADELASSELAIVDYLSAHYALRTDSGGDPNAGRVLTPRLLSLSTEQAVLALVPEQFVTVELGYLDEARIRDLMVEMTLFLETSPDHRDFSQLVWHGEQLPTTVFSMAQIRRRYAPELAAAERPAATPDPEAATPDPEVATPDPEVATIEAAGLLEFMAMGWDHILTGYDHLAFLLALIVASRRLSSLVGVVTAFTIAHSLTLALAAFDVVNLPGPLIEIAIALSIVIAGLENLIRGRPHGKWLTAFGFGLIHGLGFASFLRATFLAADSKLTALLGFNLGVEVGQLGIVIAVVIVMQFLPGRPARQMQSDVDQRAGLAPRWFAKACSLLVTGFGLYWCAERILA